MGRVLRAGFATATRRWPIVMVLWAAGALVGFVVSVVAGQWLDLALDQSLATRTVLKDLDANVLIDLWVHHRESLTMLLVVGLVFALVQLGLSIWLNAGVVAAVRDPDVALPLQEFWRRGLGLYPVFARLWLLATLVEGAMVAAVWFGARGVMRWQSEYPSEMLDYYVIAAALLLGGWMLLILVAVHDHARIYAAHRRAGALHAFGWAAWFVGRGDVRAVLLAFMLVAVGGALWGVYQTIAMWMPATSALGITISLLWGQMLLQGRALLRVVSFAAQAELQSELFE